MIVAHMVVGAGEADRYLPQVIARARSWADQVHIAVDPLADFDTKELVNESADISSRLVNTWEDHEGKFRAEAWHHLEAAYHLTTNDWVLCLDADEVIHEYDIIRQVPANFAGRRIMFTFYEIWTPEGDYRVDGLWQPWNGYIMFPYRPHGHFKDKALACGREPTYVDNLPPISRPIASLLHYGYAREADRQGKHDRYMRIDGGKFHNLGHLKSILSPAQTKPWTKGGLLEVAAKAK